MDAEPHQGPREQDPRPVPIPLSQLTPAQALERRLRGGSRTLRRREVAHSVGVSLLSARKLWRALGFPSVGDDDLAFSEGDADALSLAVGLVREGLLDEESMIAVARALGQTTDRLASWESEALVEHLVRTRGPEGAADCVELIAEISPYLERMLIYSWRRHLATAVNRLAGGDPEDLATGEATVGFADLVSYTRLSQQLEQAELSVLVRRFEALASDVVAAGGGRVIKTVGDEVLFMAPQPRVGVEIGLTISEQMAVDEVVPDVRVGVVHGPVLRSLGDVYGVTVNLASRLTGLAQPGTVVTDPGTAGELSGFAELTLVPQRRRSVRGFGQLQPMLVARSGHGGGRISLD